MSEDGCDSGCQTKGKRDSAHRCAHASYDSSCSLRTSLITVEVCTVPVLNMWAHTPIPSIRTHHTFYTLIHPCRPWINSFQLSFTHSLISFTISFIIFIFDQSDSFGHSFAIWSIRFLRSFIHNFDQLDSFDQFLDQSDSFIHNLINPIRFLVHSQFSTNTIIHNFDHSQFRPTRFIRSSAISVTRFIHPINLIPRRSFANRGRAWPPLEVQQGCADSIDWRVLFRKGTSEFGVSYTLLGIGGAVEVRQEVRNSLPFIQAWPFFRHGHPWKCDRRFAIRFLSFRHGRSSDMATLGSVIGRGATESSQFTSSLTVLRLAQ